MELLIRGHGGVPVALDRALGGVERHATGAHQVVELLFDAVLALGVGDRLGPEVRGPVGPAELERNEMVDFVTALSVPARDAVGEVDPVARPVADLPVARRVPSGTDRRRIVLGDVARRQRPVGQLGAGRAGQRGMKHRDQREP